MSATRLGLTTWKPQSAALRTLATVSSSPIARADFRSLIATNFVAVGSSTETRDIQHAAVSCVAGVADGWIFIATPFNGLWAWNPTCGTKTELIRDATAATSASGTQPKDTQPPTKAHRAESGLLPQPSASTVQSSALPLTFSNDGASALNTAAVVPSGTVDATVTVLSIVNGRLHGTYLKCEKRGAVHTVRLVASAFVALGPANRVAEWGWSNETVAIDGLSLSVATGARSNTRRTSVLVHCRGKTPAGERMSGVGVVTIDSPARTATLACPWIQGSGKNQEITLACWLSDPDHHIVCMTSKCDLSLHAIDATDRIGSATIEGQCRQVIPPTTVSSSPIANIHCWHNASELVSIVGIVAADNSFQLLSVAACSANFTPINGLIYPPLGDRFDDVRVIDEEHSICATTEGKLVLLSNFGPDVLKAEKLSAPSLTNVQFDRIKIIALQPEHGLSVAVGNVMVLVKTTT